MHFCFEKRCSFPFPISNSIWGCLFQLQFKTILLQNKKCQWLRAFEEFISFSGLKYLAVLFYQSPVNFNPHSIFFFSHQWSLWSITLNCTHKDSKYQPVLPTQLLRLLKESLECIWFQVKLFDFGIFYNSEMNA